MKKSFFAASVASLMFLPLVSLAAQTPASDFYSRIEGSGVTIIRYQGKNTAVSIPAVINGRAVTSIGSYVFSGYRSLVSITIPNSVTSINNSAFSDCSSLVSITVGEANKNYRSVDGVLFSKDGKTILLYPKGKTNTSYTIPAGVTYIGDRAFDGCRKLASVTIPNSVTSIGDTAFDGCSKLASVTIPDSVTSIGKGAFRVCRSLTSITIPNSVTSIGDMAFDGCSKLASVTVPDSVTSIGFSVFRGCSSLSSITIPDSVTSIGERAFDGCSKLASITIPNGVTSIGDSAFSNFSSLTSITIPDSVTSIGKGVFRGCSSLASVTVDDENKNYRSVDGVLFSKDGKTIMCYPARKTDSSYTIPDSVISIDDYVFYKCGSLSSITIPAGVTSIGNSAFSNCNGLSSITIPDSVTSIGERAFDGCSSLASITIHDSVSSIGSGAFLGCSNIVSITVGEANKNYRSVDGVLFSKDGKTILCYSAKKTDTSYTIPGSVESIGDGAFSDCSSLASITVDDENKNYRSVDGVLFSKDGKEILRYPARKTDTSYTIPAGVETIGTGAFSGCSSLVSLTIPGIVSVGGGAFDGCSGLVSIAILDNDSLMDTAIAIAIGAFSGLTSLSAESREAVRKNFGRLAFGYDE